MPKFRSLRIRRIAVFAFALCLAVQFGCAWSEPFPLLGKSDRTFDNKEWAIIEYDRSTGTMIHDGDEHYYFIGGSPYWKDGRWGKKGNKPVRWELGRYDVKNPSEQDAQWIPDVWGADLSNHGQLVLARSKDEAEDEMGTTEIYDFESGQPIQILRNSPLGARWSNDGKRLAIARNDGPSQFKQKIIFTIRTSEGRLHEWPTTFEVKSVRPRDEIDRALSISWSADDKFVAVSSKSAPVSAFAPLCMIFPTDGGEPFSIEAANASFIGQREFVANLESRWDKVAVMRVTDSGIEKVMALKDRHLICGSDPMSGTYLAWLPPGNYPALRFTLKLAIFEEPGGKPDESWGYNVNSTLQLVRKDVLHGIIANGSTGFAPNSAGFIGATP
ncbi:MAG: hypothetical protein KDA54_09995 [Phycisphaerales bacterium]|nr:hypothetical protein [Phycisphaerales bacterium]